MHHLHRLSVSPAQTRERIGSSGVARPPSTSRMGILPRARRSPTERQSRSPGWQRFCFRLPGARDAGHPTHHTGSTAEQPRRRVVGGEEDERERSAAGLGGEIHLPWPRCPHDVPAGHWYSLPSGADQGVPAGRSRGCLGPTIGPPPANDAAARPVRPVG